MINLKRISFLLIITITFGCTDKSSDKMPFAKIEPVLITDTVKWDTDDPAIWIHPADRSKSLIIGTDKNKDGAIYAFDIKGKIVNIHKDIARPNNVDIAYGFPFNGEIIDIAVTTERLEQRVRVFKLPELEPIDKGNLIVFNGDKNRAPMGLALYKRQNDNSFYIFVSGKSGPEKGYIGQYLLEENENNQIAISFVREFGEYSGLQEIEAIAVDNELGYVYYSDEKNGVHKYNADPDISNANEELALFATEGFASDHEGISIYKKTDTTGYIIVSDQQANQFWLFPREGTVENPHEHHPVKIIKASTESSDGNDVTNIPLPGFPEGLFVAMSEGKTFHYYSWSDIIGEDLD